MSDEVKATAAALLKAVQNDNSQHGGLISRDTIRKSDELRLALAKAGGIEIETVRVEKGRG